MANYEFVTIWRLNAPQEKVWDLIFHSENWPEWGPGVEKVERLKDGDANHVGAIHRYTWKANFLTTSSLKWSRRVSSRHF